ncbi:MAG: DUF899 family protein [Actinomycetota bacterium]|nr:DUF899 family protein [Actinomycetota bacterium]
MNGPPDASRFPNESDEYRRARNALLEAEKELRRQVEAVAAHRRELPLGGEVKQDYPFDEWDTSVGSVRPVRLSELFENGKDTLFLYNFMFKPGPQGPVEVPCPDCTSIIDGVDGAVPHLRQHINFGVVAKAPAERFTAHAHARGWRHARLLSSRKTTFNADYRAEGTDEEQFPVAHVFVRRDGRIHHFWSSELGMVPPEPGQYPRHVDFMWPLWGILDRTPGGRGGDWMPSLEYR